MIPIFFFPSPCPCSFFIFGFFFHEPIVLSYVFYWFSLKIDLGLVLVDCYLSKNETKKKNNNKDWCLIGFCRLLRWQI
jgi:hypothetical protein